MSSATPLPINEKTYLAAESASAEKHELIDGQIVAMAGASINHIDLVTNLTREILAQLKPPCRLMTSDIRVRAREDHDYYYPDLTIVCGDRNFLPGGTATLTNPTLVIEVLSKTTEFYDRGPKFEQYRRIGSLKTYLLVSQEKPLIEVYERVGHFWNYREYHQTNETIELQSIGVTLMMDRVYQDIEFEPQ